MYYHIKNQLKLNTGLGLGVLADAFIEAKGLSETDIASLLGRASLSSVEEVDLLKQIVSRIKEAKVRHEKVLVCGDYDADGICATTIMVHALRRYGVKHGFYIPNRFAEGYGLSTKTVQMAHEKGYSLLITVDNGVKAFEACEEAIKLGMDVIISDHHQYDILPPHTLFLHPQVLPKPWQQMCGAAMALLISNALIGVQNDPIVWAAIATVGDIMPLIDENRMIVRIGLSLLQRGCCIPIQKLASPFVKWDVNAIAFQVVPKLNALGRMADMANANMAVHYLLSYQQEEIDHFAKQMVSLNEYRKLKSEEMYLKCKKMIEPSQRFQILFDETFHEGLLGIAAGRIANETGLPTLVLTKKNDKIQGSARAVGTMDLMTFFTPMKKQLLSFGGHQKACALAFDVSEFESFKTNVAEAMQQLEIVNEEQEDVIAMPLSEFTLEQVEGLLRFAPFGEGWKAPLFLTCFRVVKMQRIKHEHVKFIAESGEELMLFRCPDVSHIDFESEDIGFVITADRKVYRGKRSVQLLVSDIISLKTQKSIL